MFFHFFLLTSHSNTENANVNEYDIYGKTKFRYYR